MRKIRFIAIATAAIMVLSAAGCGGATSASTAAEESDDTAVEEASEAATEIASEDFVDDESQNPVMNYVGAYSDESGQEYSLLIEAADDVDGVYVTLGYPHDEDYTYWEMYGTIKDNVITYSEGAKYLMTATEEGEEADEELAYSDGTGSFEISADNKVKWTDDKENAGEGLVFVWDEELNQMIQEMYAENGLDDETYYPDSVINWSGPYSDFNNPSRTMYIYEKDESNTVCTVVVTDENSETSMTTWTMTGEFDVDSMTISYSDCVKNDVTVDANGNEVSSETLYENGKGKFVIDEEEQTITWTDENEDAGNGSQFGFMFELEEDEDDGSTSDEAMDEEILDEEELDGEELEEES